MIVVSEVNPGDFCYIPFTDNHFLRWAYPCKFPGDQLKFRIKAYFGERNKTGKTIPVYCRDFDSTTFSVNIQWINGKEKSLGDDSNELTRQDIDEHYSDGWPKPSRVISSDNSTRGCIYLLMKLWLSVFVSAIL